MSQPAQPQSAQPVVMNSDFSYQPPPEAQPAEQAEFGQSLKDIISEIEGEWAPGPPAEEAQLDDAGNPLPEPEAEPAPTQDEPTEPDDPAVARGMERLVSREVALQAREAAFQAREARVATLEAEVTKLRAQVPARDLTERIGHSPSEVIKALGGNPEQVVKMLIAEQLTAAGKEVPAALKEELRDASTKRELDSLRRQLADREASEQHAAYFNSVATGARQYVQTKIGGSKNLPILAGIVTANPERAHRELMEEITADARQRAATDPNGEPLSYEEAAARVEARLSSLKALLSPVSPADTKQATVGTSKTPPAPKPPARPLKPWEKQGSDLESQGIEEALREFHKLESAARSRR